VSGTADFAHHFPLATLRDGQRLELSADEAERAAIAERLNLLGLDRFEAQATLTRNGDEVRAEGRLRASVTQACVASGDPVAGQVDSAFALLFRPEPTVDPDEEIELSEEDCDVIFHDGREIDLGQALADELALSLDPYPRSAHAEDALREAGVLSEAEAGPFAALAALKGRSEP
jgi:uncharacterized metal-binding protein YceD (DUF177 family)